MGQADQSKAVRSTLEIAVEGGEGLLPGILSRVDEGRAEIARLETERRALEDRILKLSVIAEDMDRAAQQFAGASLSLDVRSPELTTGRSLIRFMEMEAEGAFGELLPDIREQAKALFMLGWSNAATEPIPDGPALPEDPETWAKMRRALKLGRPLARLAREVAEGIGELRKAARQP